MLTSIKPPTAMGRMFGCLPAGPTCNMTDFSQADNMFVVTCACCNDSCNGDANFCEPASLMLGNVTWRMAIPPGNNATAAVPMPLAPVNTTAVPAVTNATSAAPAATPAATTKPTGTASSLQPPYGIISFICAVLVMLKWSKSRKCHILSLYFVHFVF